MFGLVSLGIFIIWGLVLVVEGVRKVKDEGYNSETFTSEEARRSIEAKYVITNNHLLM